MYLIQMLLPLKDNRGKAFPAKQFAAIQEELTRTFGGVTAFMRSPARGLWKKDRHVAHDDIVIFEVMAKRLSVSWWRRYRASLETIFRQDKIVIRAQSMTEL